MRKEEIQKLRENVLRGITAGIEKRRITVPQPDSRLYPQEIDRELFWVDRLSYPGAWPHAGHGSAAAPVPGLRYEVWYFQKRETALLALLCGERPALSDLLNALEPTFAALVTEGKYARRYRNVSDRSPESDLILRVEPNSRGIWRAAPQNEAKLTQALETFVIDTYPPVHKRVAALDPDGRLPQQFQSEIEERDPIAELQARFQAGRLR